MSELYSPPSPDLDSASAKPEDSQSPKFCKFAVRFARERNDETEQNIVVMLEDGQVLVKFETKSLSNSASLLEETWNCQRNPKSIMTYIRNAIRLATFDEDKSKWLFVQFDMPIMPGIMVQLSHWSVVIDTLRIFEEHLTYFIEHTTEWPFVSKSKNSTPRIC